MSVGKFHPPCGERKERSVNSFKFDASEVTRRETKLLKRGGNLFGAVRSSRNEVLDGGVTMAMANGLAGMAARGISTAVRVQHFISGKQMETSGRCWPDVPLSVNGVSGVSK